MQVCIMLQSKKLKINDIISDVSNWWKMSQKKQWLGGHQMLTEMLADVSTFDKKTINIWVSTRS